MAPILQDLAEAVVSARTELMVLVAAMVAHKLLFGLRVRATPKKVAKGVPLAGLDPAAAAPEGAAATAPVDAADRAALQALRAALADADLQAALRHLRAAAGAWRAAAGSSPSAAPDAMLQRLLRLAMEKSEAPAVLRELGSCGLLTTRAAELVLADPAQRGTAANVAQVIELAKEFGVECTSPMYCALIKSLGTEGRLGEARSVFEAVADKPSCLRNTFLDVCVNARDMSTAERVLSDARSALAADVITYNTIMKAYLRSGDTQRARAAMEVMRSEGVPPNVVTFNELIDAALRGGREVWSLIDEMQECGLEPNQVTCSILLKSIQRTSKPADLERTLGILDSMSDRVDEVLLSSVCEACIRAGRADLLRQQLGRRRQGGEDGVQVTGAHTFGSIIRAHGYIADLDGVWSRWAEMRSRNIKPTPITTGCMVEALVSNDGPEAGYRLIRELLGDEELRPVINAVIYNSVLKGFAHGKSFRRVWDMYQEMLREAVEFSIVTFNTIVDACAKSGEMAKVPELMDEMARQKIEPNVITYSTILKGYVQEGHLQTAFQLLDEMKRTKDFRPDEIAYNTLLDGCARQGLFDRGVALLQDMEEGGVKPSNFTLSVLVKLSNRCRRLEQAFQLCEQVSRKHRLRMNIHVYNNLMQACTTHKDLDRAMGVLRNAVQENVLPDTRTYSVLLRGCVLMGDGGRAAGLLRAAYGLRGALTPTADGIAMRLRGGLPTDLLSEALVGIAGQCGDEDLALQLIKELRSMPGSKVDPKVLLRLTSKVVR